VGPLEEEAMGNRQKHRDGSKKPMSAVGLLFLAALAATASQAEERIYVTQDNPPRVHVLQLAASGLEVPEGEGALQVGFEPFSLTATGAHFLVGSAFSAIGFGVLSPEGIALPPLEGAAAAAGRGIWVLGDYALHVGGQPEALGVVDLRPDSEDFLVQIHSEPLRGGGSYAATLSPDSTTLYVARAGNFGGEDRDARIDVYDLHDFPTVSYLHTTCVPWPEPFDRPVDRLRSFSLDGRDYLMLFRRDLYFLEIDQLGTVACGETAEDGTPVNLQPRYVLNLHYPGADWFDGLEPDESDPETQNPHPHAGSLRRFQDAVVDPTSRRAIAVADTLGNTTSPPNRTAFHEILVLDLSALGDDPDPAVTIRAALETQRPLEKKEAWNRLHVSLDGSTLYEITHATKPDPDRGSDTTDLVVRAWDFEGLLGSESATRIRFADAKAFRIAETKLNPGTQHAFSWGSLVRERVLAPTPAPGIDLVVRNADDSPVVANDVDSDRELRIEGSGLGHVKRAFVGARWMTGVAASANEVIAAIPPLTPAGDPDIGVLAANGAITSRKGLKVAPPPGFLPGTVAYVADGNSNTVTVLNAASEIQVLGTIDDRVVQGPNGVAVSRDGRLLFTSGFRDAQVSVHCLVADPGLGCGWNESLTTIPLTGCCGSSMELSADGSRLFVDTLWPTVDVIDTSAQTSLLPDRIGRIEISTAEDEPFRGFVRKIALAPVDAFGREWLYLANDRDPHLLMVDVTALAGDVPPEDVVEHSIPGLGVGRSDGLVVHPDGSRLYFHSSTESVVRVFTIDAGRVDSERLGPVEGLISLEGGPGVRNLEVRRPDGRFLYVAERNAGKTEIFDLELVPPCAEPPCELATRVAVRQTGPNSNRLRSTPAGDFVYVPAGGSHSVAILDARDGSATQHEVLTASGTGLGPGDLAFSPGIATETGNDVTVTPLQGVEVTFDDVLAAGSTTVTSANLSHFELPPDFEIAGTGVAVYYEVDTTAEFEGLVTICFAYDDSAMAPEQEASLGLLHDETCSPLLESAGATGCHAGAYGTDMLTDWTEFVCTASGASKGDCAAGQEGATLAGHITQLPVDTANNRICGRVGSFSQFVAAVRTVWPVAIDIQPGESPNEISSRSRGKLEVAILSSALVDATTVVVSTVEVGGVAPLAQAEIVDVDGDGRVDLVVRFDPPTLGLPPGAHELELVAELGDGRRIRGSETLQVK
jgi:DNA-binding beta-propeller fold protein YncE